MATSDQISALEAAIAAGVLEVQYQDRRVRYQSIADMLQAMRYLREQVAASSPANTGGRVVRVCME